jgi:histone acetyltransferase SAS3
VNVATLLEYGMAAAPSDFEGRSQEANDDFLSEDEDAEHEDDTMMDQMILGGGFYDISHGAEVSDIDAEHDEVDEEDEDDHEPVGAVKLPDNDSEDGIDDDQDDANSVEVGSSEESDGSDKVSSDSDSDVEREWEEASNDQEEEEAEAANPNHCMQVEHHLNHLQLSRS